MEKGDGRQDKKFSENSNSSKEKGKSKFPSLEPSKWAKYHQGVFNQPQTGHLRQRPRQQHQQGSDESDDEMDDLDTLGASSSSGDTFRQQPKMEEPMDTSPQVHRPDFQFDGEVVDCSSVEGASASCSNPTRGTSTVNLRRPHSVLVEEDSNLFGNILNDNGLYISKFNNNGNSCYANSTLTLLLNCGSFMEILSMLQQSTSNFVKELVKLAQSPEEVKDTEKLRILMSQHPKKVFDWSLNHIQHDLPDFLSNLFEILIHEVQSLPNAETMIENTFTSQCTLVYKCESGGLMTGVECENYLKTRREFPFMILPVAGEHEVDFVSVESSIEANDQFLPVKCRSCFYNDNLEKMDTVPTKIPSVLMIQLGLYDEFDANRQEKIQHNINFETLLRPWGAQYDSFVLIGASLHHGQSMIHGHYTTLLINPVTMVATEINDSKVGDVIRGEANIQHALKKSYVLVYERKDAFDKRHLAQSPMKKRPKSMDVEPGDANRVKRNLGDFNKSKNVLNKEFLYKFLTGELWFDVQMVPPEDAIFYCRKLGLSDEEFLSAPDPRKKMEEYFVKIIWESELSESDKEDLSDIYNIKLRPPVAVKRKAVKDKDNVERQQVEDNIVQGRAYLNFKELTDANVRWYLNILTCESWDGLEQQARKDKLREVLVKLIRTQVEDPDDQEDLLKQYKIPTDVKKKKSPVQKMVLKMAKTVKTMHIGSKRSLKSSNAGTEEEELGTETLPTSPHEIVKVLDMLQKDQLSHKDLKRYTKDEKHEATQLKQSLKGMLISSLIKSLTVAQIREILPKPDKNLKQLPGQIKSAAMGDNNILQTIIDTVINGSAVDSPDLDTCAGIAEQLTKQLTRTEMKTIHRLLFNEDAPKKQGDGRINTKIRKTLVEMLIGKLEKAKLDQIMKTMHKDTVAPSKQKAKLKSIVVDKEFEKLAAFLDLVKGADPQPICVPSQQMEQRDTETTSEVEVEESLLPTATEMNDEVSDNVTKMDARRYIDELRANLTKPALIEMYSKLGGKGKAVRSAAFYEEFIKRHCLGILLKNLPSPGMYMLQTELDLPTSTKAALQKHAMEHSDTMDAIISLFDRAQEQVLNDFYPLTWEKITERQQELSDLRKDQTETLFREGRFTMSPDNPLLKEGIEIEKKCEDLKREHCVVCRETRFESNVDPDTGICARCTKTKPKNEDEVWLYGEDNEMYPGEQPEVLKDLTLIEQAAISRLHVQMRIIRYRGGGTALRGHSMLFRQDIPKFYKELPCNPEDLPIIILVPPHETRTPLEANRYKIKFALEWLKEHNPYYADIEINESNLARYPIYSNTPVNGLSTIQVAETAEERSSKSADDEDDDHHGAEAEGDLVETLINEEAPVEMTRQRIRSALNIGTLGENAVRDPYPWAPRIPGRVSEFERNGLLSQGFPHLFPWGKGDYFLPRQKDVKLLDYVQHLIWLDIPGEKENRFAKDPRFLFYVTNMHGRHTNIMLAHVYTSNIIKDLTMEQVKEALQDPNSNLSQCMVHMSAQIPGTNAYFAHARKLVKATEEWIRIASYGWERFNTFLTFSLPDSHMEQLHKFLPGSEQYLGKTPVESMVGKDDRLFIDKKEDYQLRQRAVQNNLHIVDEFVHIKLNLLKNMILKPYLGMTDYVIRAEFQSRTAIHFHIIGRCMNAPHLEDMEIAFKKYLFVEEFKADCYKFGMSEEEIQREIFKEKRAGYVIVEPSEAMEVRDTVFPAREKTVQFAKNILGLSALHPEMDSDQWPPKYGYNMNPPSSNALRTSLKSVPNDEQSLVQDYAELVSRVELHYCRKGYCKKDIPHPSMPPPATTLGPCRFGFDKEKQGFKTVPKLDTDGQEIPGKNDYVMIDDVREQYPDGARIVYSTLDLMRNHPQLVEHIPEFLSIWRGNIDCKLIKNVATLIEYVCKYVTKPESSSMRYNEIMQEIAKATTDDQTRGNVKKMVTKIFMTFIKEHDIGKPEAIKIISQRPFVDISRKFSRVTVTDKRRVNVELYQAGVTEAPALNKNHADKYWTREESEDYQRALERYEENPLSMLNPRTVNLYTFTGLFDKNWRYTGIWKVPVPSPLFTRWPNKIKLPDAYNECCKVKLLLFKPGVNPTNILWKNLENEDDGKFESLEAAMLDFATDRYSQCPKHTAKQFLKQYDPPEEELLFGGEVDDIDDVDQLIQAQGDPEVEGEILPGLGPTEFNLLNDANDDALMEMMFAEEMDENEDFEMQHDQQHNWHADRERLGLTGAEINEGKHWIDDRKRDPTVVLQVAERHYEVQNLNPVQRKVYDKAMQAIDNPDEQVLIDVCGSAGTGKSYTINTILQNAEAGSVQILAPTGAAACQFVGGKTLHSFLKLNVSKARSQKGQERSFKSLTEAQAQSLERNLEDVKLLIIDEKGMVGMGRLYQICRRLQEGRPHKRDQPFGGMSILIAGDLRQLQPVCDIPLYGELTDQNQTEVTSTGLQLYRLFDTETFKLEQQMRQRGAENAEFREELDSLGDLGKLPNKGKGNKDTYVRWKKKMDYYKMSEERRADFDKNATLIAMKKVDLKDFNKRHVLDLGSPICLAKAENKPDAAKTYTDDEADGLMNQLALAHDAKFVLTRNLWQEAGLVNGAICFIHSIIFKEGADTTGDRLPDMLLLKFPKYTGPSYLADEEKIVPIYPIQATWHTRDKDEMSRTQFPLIPGYAITVHKAQGMTLGKAIVKTCKNEFQHGLLYTACTRVTNEDDLAFIGYEPTLMNQFKFPPIQRFNNIHSTIGHKRMMKENERKNKLWVATKEREVIPDEE